MVAEGWRLPVVASYSTVFIFRPSVWWKWGVRPSLVDVNRASKDTTVKGAPPFCRSLVVNVRLRSVHASDSALIREGVYRRRIG